MRIKKTQAAKELARFLRNSLFWNIVTMLRGPDFDAPQELKCLTVGRIRVLVGVTEPRAHRLGLVITTTPLDSVQQKRRDYLLRCPDVSIHFRRHYESAVAALRIVANYDLLTETPIKRIRK